MSTLAGGDHYNDSDNDDDESDDAGPCVTTAGTTRTPTWSAGAWDTSGHWTLLSGWHFDVKCVKNVCFYQEPLRDSYYLACVQRCELQG